MGRRTLPRFLSENPTITRVREFSRTVADNAADVLHPLIVVSRGLRSLAASGRRKWAETPKERRGPTVVLVGSCVFIVALVPYGPVLATIGLMAAAAWAGRRNAPQPAAEVDEADTGRLQALYEALVPYFAAPGDPAPLYAHGGSWSAAFEGHAFDDRGRLTALRLRYPAYFTDGDAESRTRIEQLLHLKAGRGREYRFDWDEAGNRLALHALPALDTDVFAQRFVTAPGEAVLGFTDASDVQRTLPVTAGDETRDAPPVVWRTGQRSTEPHLLALGQPSSGTTTLLRSIALQVLHHGDVVVVDGSGAGEYAFLRGRDGVLAVESSLPGALATLEWAAHETERRLLTANHARQQGRPTPEDIRRPLWVIVDRPTVLSHLARGEGRRDPQELLQVPLRHGRVGNVTVAVAEQLDGYEQLTEPVRTHTRARLVLGAVTPDQVCTALGAPPHTTPARDVPPGRGYARLGSGPVHRVQVPHTPNPYDEETTDAQREAVLSLLPETAPVPGAAEDPWSYADPAPTAASAPPPVSASVSTSVPISAYASASAYDPDPDSTEGGAGAAWATAVPAADDGGPTWAGTDPVWLSVDSTQAGPGLAWAGAELAEAGEGRPGHGPAGPDTGDRAGPHHPGTDPKPLQAT
ncbi:hypothetical protein SNS2_0344 [Streptomyces netropsis]|uniref:YD repeat-containing protein n=1 Tax=Streptomyces syringium TaxID=76729 RepID=A0ABS4XZ66_9ACTN|nr:hypothetical protein [Streptomyces syringium]MBP2401814.1 YD repeat-containing protein [Streptomyces syringium]SPE48259.1 hypothetical protein SNS2_0344 [Streptomyces netropsis]